MSGYYFIENLIFLGWVARTPGQVATQHLTTREQQLGALIVPKLRKPHSGLAVWQCPRSHARTG
jgi:hypothetical protein